jgi:hypothetical protein
MRFEQEIERRRLLPGPKRFGVELSMMAVSSRMFGSIARRYNLAP